MHEAQQPVVTALVGNLFFAVPIADAVRAAGAQPEVLENVGDLWPAIERWPALVLLDLAVPGDWQSIIRRAKALPQTRSIPVVAFGSHVDTATLRAAREAGCDHAWARSYFVNALPQLLQETLCPPARWPAGWDEPPPPQLCTGVAQFNQGEYWECHETLEGLWMAETRPVRDLYQGVLQIGVAFHHLHGHNYAGALKMLRRGLPRLRGLPEVTQGVRVAELARAAREVHNRLAALGPDRLDQFDLLNLPQIEMLAVCV
jgi:uncharacterized protein